MVAVRVEGVRKSYGEVEAVRGVSFEVLDGELFGLLGPNGAGKTTLMRMIVGILPPDEGRIEIKGIDVWRSPKAVKRIIGYSPQENVAYSDHTGYENLMFYAGLYGIPRGEARRRAKELLELVGLSDAANRRVETYSGGMKRRLNLAIALVNDPEVLILDEPTTGLDPRVRREVWDVLLKLRGEGKSILMATHYMEEAEALSMRVGIMDEGRIVALDNPEELKRRVGLRSVIEVEISGEGNPIPILSEFSADGKVLSRDRVYRVYTMDPEGDVPRLVSRLASAGFKIVRVSVEEPTLEDVFLKLTGKRLGEEV